MASKKLTQRKAIQNQFERLLKFDDIEKLKVKKDDQKKLVKQLSKDFLKISSPTKKNKKQLLNEKNNKAVNKKRIHRDIINEFKKTSKVKLDKNILSSRFHLNKIQIKDKIEYDRLQKDFLLVTPKIINQDLLISEKFISYINNTFKDSIETSLKSKSTFKKGKRRFISIGYHFYFKKSKQISVQTGYRMRQLLRSDNFETVLKYQLSETLERFNKYFHRKGNSTLYFEGLTLEISFLK